MTGAMSPQELYLQRMLSVARVLVTDPGREMTPEEVELFVKGARALAEMFLNLNEELSSGAQGPDSWGSGKTMDGLPTSTLHEKLKAAADAGVMRLLQDFGKLGNKTGLRLTTQLGELMVTLGRFTSESVRLASVNRLAAEKDAGMPSLMLLDRPKTDAPVKSGRSADIQEDSDAGIEDPQGS